MHPSSTFRPAGYHAHASRLVTRLRPHALVVLIAIGAEEYDAARPDATPIHGVALRPDRCCAIIELRRYTLHPGQRETLIELFDREFVEPQEALGMTIVGQYRDLDEPNVFTWIRGFPDMPSRAKGLEAFYFGPVWARHRQAANATMVSSDNVRLLHPANPATGFPLLARAPARGAGTPAGLLLATIYTLTDSGAAGFAEYFDRTIVPILVAHGVRPVAVFETEQSANNFPRLPVREGEHAFVWFARFDDPAAHERFSRALAADERWTGAAKSELDRRSAAPAEIWRLTPTGRSRGLQ